MILKPYFPLTNPRTEKQLTILSCVAGSQNLHVSSLVVLLKLNTVSRIFFSIGDGRRAGVTAGSRLKANRMVINPHFKSYVHGESVAQVWDRIIMWQIPMAPRV
jgi:hypothetical protein